MLFRSENESKPGLEKINVSKDSIMSFYLVCMVIVHVVAVDIVFALVASMSPSSAYLVLPQPNDTK